MTARTPLELAQNALIEIEKKQIKSVQAVYLHVLSSQLGDLFYIHRKSTLPIFKYKSIPFKTLQNIEHTIGNKIQSQYVTIKQQVGNLTENSKGKLRPIKHCFTFFSSEITCETKHHFLEKLAEPCDAEDPYGNCAMQAAWVYLWLEQQSEFGKYEINYCEFKHVDHALVRIKKGDEIVFCDPYAYTCYPEADLAQNMQALLNTHSIFFKEGYVNTQFEYMIFDTQESDIDTGIVDYLLSKCNIL
ncbi:MAG: hypothetical protein ACK4PR_00080 [Gammaproteobacteria bacterium]